MSSQDFLREPVAQELVDKILDQSGSSIHYSVFWAKHLKSFDLKNPLNWKGIGSGAFLPLTSQNFAISFRALIEVYCSAVLSRVRIPLARHPEIKTAHDLCLLADRAFDYDVWRHSQVLRVLDSFRLPGVPKVCVIGDGLATMIGMLYLQKDSKTQVLISVNLPEILLLDYLLLRKIGVSPEEIKICSDRDELNRSDNSWRVVLVLADDAKILKSSGIDLFINIDSMQEMTPGARQEYFEIIGSNSAYFYCCNMIEKTMRDGTRNKFLEYPWGNSNLLVDEEPAWLRRFIRVRYPWGRFRVPVGVFKTPHLHRLVKFG
jgi:hypothetical protein